MGNVEARIRMPGQGQSTQAGQAITVTAGSTQGLTGSTNELPCIEWTIDDDCMNVADSASFSIANIDGENTGKLFPLQLVIIEVRDPDVAGGQWVSAFKGRILRLVHRSDQNLGSLIVAEAMDLGWHLTRCCATPLTSTASGTIDQLILKLVDPSWGINRTAVTHGNVKNRQLKQGRFGVELSFIPELQKQFIRIQVEIGQTPWQVLSTYAARLGLAINVGVQGDIILFQPDYQQKIDYDAVHYHKSTEGERIQNNIIGTPTFEESGDGLYSSVLCFSTVVAPLITQSAQQQQDPNAQYRSAKYTPTVNPVPFVRVMNFMDSEAINKDMQVNRAIWKAQTDAFNSWSYTVELPQHSSGGVFFASDSMISVSDTVHQVQGSLYVQKVRRSYSVSGGTRAQLTLRLPWLWNPSLQAQVKGSGNVQSPQYTVGFVNGVLQLVPKVVS